MERMKHVSGSAGRGEAFMGRIALERGAECRLDGAGMEADDNGLGIFALPLDRDIADKHIKRGF